MWTIRKLSKILTNSKFVRHKHAPDHWSVVRKKNKPTDKALAHFDDFYKQIYHKKWETIRKALFNKQKYVAIVNNYSDSDEIMRNFELNGALNVRRLFELEKQRIFEEIQTKRRRKLLKQIKQLDELTEKQQTVEDVEIGEKSLSLESSLNDAELDYRRLIEKDSNLSAELLNEFIPTTQIKGRHDYIPESHHYQYYQTNQFNVKIERDYQIEFPQYLNVYCYEEENFNDFEPARIGTTGVLDYYLMDGASILPVLALDLKPNDSILDMCAAPGGKTLLMLQTLYPDCVVSNDISKSRTDRIYNVCRQFLYDFNEKWLKSGRLKITCNDGRRIINETFDKILVDVPCTTDRLSLHVDDNNMFKPSRIKERLKLPELQCELLVAALKLVRKGGIVVYSTCSLSPIQNDGVVHMALKRIWEETKLNFVVRDLSIPLLQTRNFLYLADMGLMKYGHLIVPQPGQNYGPMFFCKLQRLD